MSRIRFKTAMMGSLSLVVTLMLVGCEPKGPAQQAGENLDKAGTNLKNAVDPRGPAEKLGDKVDQATGR